MVGLPLQHLGQAGAANTLFAARLNFDCAQRKSLRDSLVLRYGIYLPGAGNLHFEATSPAELAPSEPQFSLSLAFCAHAMKSFHILDGQLTVDDQEHVVGSVFRRDRQVSFGVGGHLGGNLAGVVDGVEKDNSIYPRTVRPSWASRRPGSVAAGRLVVIAVKGDGPTDVVSM